MPFRRFSFLTLSTQPLLQYKDKMIYVCRQLIYAVKGNRKSELSQRLRKFRAYNRQLIKKLQLQE